MKRKIVYSTLALLLFTLSACAPKPNMEELLSYQTAGTEMSLRITDTEVFYANLKIEDGGVSITFTDEKREGISYGMDKSGQIRMFFEDVEIPLDPSDELKCKDWLSLFAIPHGDNIWRIKRETLGGISVYVCRDERITLYIDAASGLPLKIEMDRITIDVLNAKRVDSEQQSIQLIMN
ncbi:MAG: hypothetical protein IJD59_10985 [Clostridia bacterium]|nr:hypothetical protein [Clostridia bacterium]